jgi:GDP-L-fucose synthase
MKLNSKIFVSGHKGLVGSALCRKLNEQGYTNILTISKDELDLRNQKEVDDWFLKNRPDYVFLAAAKVGGIGYNKSFPADFIRDNIQIQTNIIESSRIHNIKKLCFLGTACIYPKHAPVPIKEEYLMTGPLEETNIGYALAKITGLVMCKKYYEQYGLQSVCVMPNNLYGVNDNFRPSECHVIPSFINRFIAAKEQNLPEVICFGDGTPTREFLFADDMADSCIFLMKNHNDDPTHINVGPNREVSIKELSELVARLVGYEGKIIWDTNMPNGTPRRALDTTKMDSFGWKAKTSLEEGLKITIDWFLENRKTYERV